MLFVLYAEVDSGCSVYTNMTEPWRNILSTSFSGNTDNYITPGWYRMIQNGLNAKMPTFCPAALMCGTYSPMWYSGTKNRQICTYINL